MNKLKWWLRIVGARALILGIVGLWASFFNPQLVATPLPMSLAADELAVRAFSDANIDIGLVTLVLGVLMLYASREPSRASGLVLTVAMLELFAWTIANLLWMLRGWPPANVIPFTIQHFIIGVTGLLFLRQAKAE